MFELIQYQPRYQVAADYEEHVDTDESSLETAKRELLEETGYVAQEWTSVCTMLPCIGYSDERIEFFLARTLSFKGASLDEGEFLETLRLPVSDALQWVREGKIRDSKSMLGLLWLDHILHAGW